MSKTSAQVIAVFARTDQETALSAALKFASLGWTPEQFKEFCDWFNAAIAGKASGDPACAPI